MFTGIITDVGHVRSLSHQQGEDMRMQIAAHWTDAAWGDLQASIGESIACSGVCLTVVERGEHWFAVDVSDETAARSTLGSWRVGDPVNLERALRVGEALGGHLVTGHVDGRVVAVDQLAQAGSVRWRFRVARAWARFIASKGSVALDGVSLTVNEVEDTEDGSALFTVNIIPHTQTHTALGRLSVKDEMNFEVDCLARYLDRLCGGGRQSLQAEGAV